VKTRRHHNNDGRSRIHQGALKKQADNMERKFIKKPRTDAELDAIAEKIRRT
jgi:hypothetical protein